MITASTKSEIQVALQAQDFSRAGSIAETALEGGQSDTILFQLAAIRRQQLGDLTGGAELLLNAVQLSPRDPVILTAAADGLRQIGRLEHSLTLFDDALALDQGMVAAWYGRALLLEAAGSLDEARQSYKRVTELEPNAAPGFAGLSTTSAQIGEMVAARHFATRAWALDQLDPATCMALARCEMADGNHDRAVELLQQTAQDQVDVLTLLGDAFDRLGHFERAYDAYARANSRFAASCPASDEGVSLREQLIAIERAVTALDIVDWTTRHLAPSPVANHVFLLGYPRSGTTLVELALASLPAVATLEEAGTLYDAQEFLTHDGISRLAKLSDAEIDVLRANYWQRVAETGVDFVGKTFVDMDPSKSMGLPLIARIFPEAKIVVMRRDPRDVIWSCFRRSFVYSPMTCEFSTLERTASHYDAVMRLSQACFATFPMNSHDIVYEDLVRDFDVTTKGLCAFLGLPWSVAIKDFSSTARAGRVKTVSAVQVRQPLFDGSGQWRNYSDRMTTILPLLERWVNLHEKIMVRI